MTEQKNAGFFESEYRAIFDSVSDGIVIHEADTLRILDANDTLREIYGFSREDMRHITMDDLCSGIPPYTVDNARTLMQKAFTGLPQVFEWQGRARNGRLFWIEVSLKAVTLGGKLRGLAIVRDITERKKSDEALRDALKRFESVVENTPLVAVQGFDMDGVIRHWNDASKDLYGYDAGEVIGLRLQDVLFSEEDALEFEGLIKKIAMTGQAIDKREWKVTARNGSKKCIYSTIFPVFEHGKIVEVFCMDVDITDRVKAEESLMKAKQELELKVEERTQELLSVNKFMKNVFDCIQDGISVLDKDLNIIKVNHALEEWHPYMMPLEGKKCYYAYHNRTGPCEICPSLAALKTRKLQVAIVPFTGQHGDRGWLEIYSFPLLDDKGNVTGVIEHVRDITERRKMELELSESKNQSELYLDLMSHDINNLNQVCMSNIEVAMMKSGLDPESRALLSGSVEAIKSSSRLIDSVRKLQRVRTGLVEREKVDVGAFLDDVLKTYATVPGRDVTINYEHKPGCFVMADKLLADVFSNLVNNAIKHTTGPVTIDILLNEYRLNDKRYFKVVVQDDGPGIPDKIKRGLFDRYRRGITKTPGTGLGLYIVKTLVEAYGGRVWVEDRIVGEPEKGAKFVVLLPAL